MVTGRGPHAAVVAYGACNGLGSDAQRGFDALLASQVAASPPPLELPFETVCGVAEGAPLPAEWTPYTTRLLPLSVAALEPVLPALQRVTRRYGADRVGFVFGSSTGGLDRTERAFAQGMRDGRPDASFDLDSQHSFFAVPSLIAARFGLRGPCFTTSTACSSSAKSLASALRLLRHGVCDAVLVGGADGLCETTLRGFHGLGLLSTRASRPFCAQRDGIHIGEGAAFLLLEAGGEGPAHIASVGESSDGHAMTAPHPEGRGAVTAIEQALAHAGLHSEQVDYVNAHGTGTLQNDVAESAALRTALPEEVAVSSTKGATGHLLGAAAITEAVFCVQAVERGVMPANTGASPRDDVAPAGLLEQNRQAPVRAALSTSLAFGGSVTCVTVVAP